MDLFTAALLIAALAALVVLPVMVLIRLRGARHPDAERDGDGWLLRPSPATMYAAAFCLVPWLGVAARRGMGRHEPDYSIWNTGPVMGLGLAILGTAVAAWLLVRHRRRRIRFDAGGIETVAGRRSWDDLGGAALEVESGIGPTVLVLTFRDGGAIRVRPDILGRRRLIDHVRRLCKRRGLPYEGRPRKRSADA